MNSIKEDPGQTPAEYEKQQSLAEKEKWDHQKFMIKAFLCGSGLTHEAKRALLIEVMQELDIIRSKVIEEVRR